MGAAEQIDALSKSVVSLDKTRRVGFGKAYDAESKLDSALHDLGVVRGDREAYRRGLSWLYGFMSAYIDTTSTTEATEVVSSLLGEHPEAILDDVVARAGRRAGTEAARFNPRYDTAVRRANVRVRARESAKLFREATKAAEKRLAAQYGFRSVEELRLFLSRAGEIQ